MDSSLRSASAAARTAEDITTKIAKAHRRGGAASVPTHSCAFLSSSTPYA
jgi:hypothetical protein